MMKILVANTTQIPNFILDQLMPHLSDTELRILLIVCRQTLGWVEDAATGRRKEKDWISYSQLRAKTGRRDAAISAALRGLEEKHLIEIYDKYGKKLSTKAERLGKALFYRVSTSLKSEEVGANLFEKRKSESEDTKETLYKKNVKTLSPISPLYSTDSHNDNVKGNAASAEIKDNSKDNGEEISYLIERIEEFTGQNNSKAFYKKMIKILGPGRVEMELGEAKHMNRIGQLKHRGKYLTWLLKDVEKQLQRNESSPNN